MIKEAIATGKGIDDATQAAKRSLNAPADAEVKTEVLAMPSKKTFGIFGGSPAKVRAYYEIEEVTPPVKAVKPASVLPTEVKEAVKAPVAQKSPAPMVTDDQADGAQAYLQMMIDGMGVKNAKVNGVPGEGTMTLTVEAEDYGIIIGRRGETLDSLQYLVSLLVNRGREDYIRVTINVGDYRQKREDTLRAIARRNAMAVVRTGRRVTLEPMNPYERRIIHTTVQDVKGAASRSVGSNADRRVVIELAEGFKPTGGYGRDHDNRSAPRGNYNNNRSRANTANNRGERRDDRREKPPVTTATSPKKEDKQETPLYGRIDVK